MAELTDDEPPWEPDRPPVLLVANEVNIVGRKRGLARLVALSIAAGVVLGVGASAVMALLTR